MDRETRRLQNKKICKDCRYYHSLGGSSYACGKIVGGEFALTKCLSNGHYYFRNSIKVHKEEEPVNLFTDIWRKNG